MSRCATVRFSAIEPMVGRTRDGTLRRSRFPSGSGTLEAGGESYPIDADHAARVGPEVKRKIVPGPDGLRLLAIGATPGRPYETGGAL